MTRSFLLLAITALLTSCGVKLNKARGLEVTYRNSSTGELIELEESKILSVCSPSVDNIITATVFTGSEFKSIPYELDTKLVPNVLYAGSIDLIQSSIGIRGYKKNIIDNGNLLLHA